MGLLKAANSRKGRAIHRWVGIVVAAYVVMATLSGLIHIIMANFFAPPPPVMPQGVMYFEEASLPLAKIVESVPGTNKIKGVNLRSINDQLWYQFIVENEAAPIYVNAANGKLGEGLDEAYAKQIAAAYLKKDKLEKTNYLTGFDGEYLNIFRALPVYRFETGENGERVYVSTITGSVTLYLNKWRALGQNSFSALHKLSFIPNKIVRDVLQTLLVLGICFTTIMGTFMFFSRYARKN